MRRFLSVIVISAVVAVQPVAAVGLGDLAKVVLNGNSILKKGAQTCGSKLALTTSDTLTMETARSAVKKVLPQAQFLSLDTAAQTDATTQAKAPTFCNDTQAKKPGLLGKIGEAGKSILKAKLGNLGNLGNLGF